MQWMEYDGMVMIILIPVKIGEEIGAKGKPGQETGGEARADGCNCVGCVLRQQTQRFGGLGGRELIRGQHP